jgi:hypothetical protein
MKKFLACLTGIFFSCPVMANPLLLKDLWQACTTEEKDDMCRYYILGVAEEGASKDKGHFCIPDGTSDTKIVFPVKQSIGNDLMSRNPKNGDMPAASYVAAVLLKSFPCTH